MGLIFLITEDDQATIGLFELEALENAYSDYLVSYNFLTEILLVDKEKIQSLNKEHRQIDEATDVLSFPTFEEPLKIFVEEAKSTLLGTIVICPEKALIYQETLAELVHHGILHLLGFDHETSPSQWLEVEGVLLTKLKNQDLIIKGIPHEHF